MAIENYNIYDVANYITSMRDGGTILFYPLLSSDNPSAPGQVWAADDGLDNTTISCTFTSGAAPLYLTANSAAEGEYIGSVAGEASENAFWSISDDGSLQLINNGSLTGLFAIVGDNGLLTLSPTPKTKWKFSKSLQSVKGWEEHK